MVTIKLSLTTKNSIPREFHILELKKWDSGLLHPTTSLSAWCCLMRPSWEWGAGLPGCTLAIENRMVQLRVLLGGVRGPPQPLLAWAALQSTLHPGGFVSWGPLSRGGVGAAGRASVSSCPGVTAPPPRLARGAHRPRPLGARPPGLRRTTCLHGW